PPDRVASAPRRDVGRYPPPDGGQPAFLEPRDLRLCEGIERKVGERRPAPQCQRLAQELGSLLRVLAREGTPALVQKLLEAIQVEAARLETERIARALREEEAVVRGLRFAFERSAELRDVVLD